MQDNVNNALVEVRKAYRLLADYQRKVLDLIDFIGSSYGRIYQGGYAKYGYPTPRNGKGNLDLWGWDWINMYFYEFHFGKELVGNHELFFSIFIVSDTGYYNERKTNSFLDKTDTELFTKPEESETKLIFLIGKNKWEAGGLFDENFNKPEFILPKEGSEGKDDNIMIFKSYPLAEFSSQENAEKQLKDFELYCKQFDIDFNLIEKEISN